MPDYTTYSGASAAYLESVGYDVSGSAALAAEHIQACRALIHLQTTAASQGGASAAYDVRLLQSQLDAALAWYQANGTNAAAARLLSIADGDDYP